ncbi:hypothetical protein EJU54_21875 [Salmonella enterica]|nr:hypothetical protein [Salmonella enterica]EAZ5201898.1 hypothetical protein [Salmonella enterica]EBR6980928.1 hypothetical protein [Salmonella enterica]QLA85437.1 hypothetical protein E8N14_08035 [Salmonella enterica subsp. enterica serovar Newport]
MFAGKKSAQIREILISESAWEEMTCLFAPSLKGNKNETSRFYYCCSRTRYVCSGPSSDI